MDDPEKTEQEIIKKEDQDYEDIDNFGIADDGTIITPEDESFPPEKEQEQENNED